jgi:hypothetical protein
VVAKQLRELVAASSGIELSIVDVAAAAEAAQAAGVQAVPTLFVDGRLRLTGSVNVDDVGQLLAAPRTLTAPALQRLIEQGNADALAELMERKGVVFPALVGLLAESTFSVRLGAMAVAEKLCERNQALTATIADPLWTCFAEANDPVRGDILYLLGEMGADHLLPQIEAVASGSYSDDVKEAAQEAVDALRADETS